MTGCAAPNLYTLLAAIAGPFASWAAGLGAIALILAVARKGDGGK